MIVPSLPAGAPAEGEDSGPSADVRLECVTQVLHGESIASVARRASVEAAVVHRWVRLFTDAGTARLTNQPEESLARQRDRFLAAFAHELRTPLTIARGWAAMLAEGDLDEQETEATLATLCSSLDLLTERTEEVEMLAAASLGRLRVRRRACQVGDLLALLAPEEQLLVGDARLMTYTDPSLARRVVRDLWEASRTAPEPRERRIEVRRAARWIELDVVRVADPIETHVLQAMMDPFDSGEDDTGVTTGLYLARALTVSLGGTLGIEQDDQGATFRLRLPLAPPPQEDPMTFTLACGDVMPGCPVTFEHDDRNALLADVARHASADHGIEEIGPEVLDAVNAAVVEREG